MITLEGLRDQLVLIQALFEKLKHADDERHENYKDMFRALMNLHVENKGLIESIEKRLNLLEDKE